jgi:ring-1,2-phenylacetyl-CoA epoxidase subunit PaaC
MMTPLKTQYILQLADNALILGQRLSEWCGHGPVLEQDIALTNMALDHVGQARLLYQYLASQHEGTTEDSWAMLRTEREYRNVQLLELPRGEWDFTMARQFVFDAFNYFQYAALRRSDDPELAAIAAKAIKEITYHAQWSAEWMIRLGDGTEESHLRMQQAIDGLWPYTGELFMPSEADHDAAAQGYGINPESLHTDWTNKVHEVLAMATLAVPASGWMHRGGKQGIHTEHMGFLLPELQYLQRAYPNAEW